MVAELGKLSKLILDKLWKSEGLLTEPKLARNSRRNSEVYGNDNECV